MGTFLIPDEYPFTLSQIKYAVGTSEGTPCNAGLGHNIQIYKLPNKCHPNLIDSVGSLVTSLNVPQAESINFRQIELKSIL